jgi:hypothetical protein
MHFRKFCSLGVCGLNLKPTIVWIGAIINGTSVTIILELDIATKYNGTDLIGSI